MKTTDARWNDESRTPGSGNVFVDLGFDPAEAEVMKLRAEVMIRTAQRLKEQGWTQAEAAKHLGVTQPRVSDLLRGKISLFGLDSLVNMVAAAGHTVDVRVRDAA